MVNIIMEFVYSMGGSIVIGFIIISPIWLIISLIKGEGFFKSLKNALIGGLGAGIGLGVIGFVCKYFPGAC